MSEDLISPIVIILAYEIILIREISAYITGRENGFYIFTKKRKKNLFMYEIDNVWIDNLGLWENLKLAYEGDYQDVLLKPILIKPSKDRLLTIDEWEKDYLRRKNKRVSKC